MALLYSWNTQVSTQVDADSPLVEDITEGWRQNDWFLRQVLYGDGSGGFKTPADGHVHNGTDSKGVVVPNDTIGRGPIKHAATEANWFIAQLQNQILPEGFYIAIWESGAAGGGVDGLLQAFLNGTWQTMQSGLNTAGFAGIYSDGANIRIRNVDASNGITVYYRRMNA